MEHEPTPQSPQTALQTIDQEHLDLYLSWAEVEVPRWYWPAFAVTIAAWIASYSFGPWGGVLGALAAAAIFGAMAGTVMQGSGISMPRYRTMPPVLRRPFLVALVAHIAVAATVIVVAVLLADPPFVVIGAIAGAVLGVFGAASTRWYRASAAKLRAQQGR